VQQSFFLELWPLICSPSYDNSDKAVPIQVWAKAGRSTRLRFSVFPENCYTKVLSLLALCTGRLYQEILLLFIYATGWVHHSAVRRIKSMKNPNIPIGNRNHDIPVCSAVPVKLQ
jgi:hypothetical protein